MLYAWYITTVNCRMKLEFVHYGQTEMLCLDCHKWEVLKDSSVALWTSAAAVIVNDVKQFTAITCHTLLLVGLLLKLGICLLNAKSVKKGMLGTKVRLPVAHHQSSSSRSVPIIEHSRLHKLTPLWTILRTHGIPWLGWSKFNHFSPVP